MISLNHFFVNVFLDFIFLGFIMQIVGISRGRKDDGDFQTALWFVIAGIVVLLIKGKGQLIWLNAVVSGAVDILSLFVMLYVIKAIGNLAQKLKKC